MTIGRWFRLAATTLGVVILIGLLAPVASAAPRTVVTFTFDNDTASQYALGYQQALLPHGMTGTFFTSSGTVGVGPGFMSWAQLADLQANGNEVGGRTAHFTDLTAVSDQVATDETCGDRQVLMQHGLNVSSFAYPYGAFNASAEAIVASCGYGVARSGGGIVPGGSNVWDRSLRPICRRRLRPIRADHGIRVGVAGDGRGRSERRLDPGRDPERLLAEPRSHQLRRLSGLGRQHRTVGAQRVPRLARRGGTGRRRARRHGRTDDARTRHLGRPDAPFDHDDVRRRAVHHRPLRELHQRDADGDRPRLGSRQHPLHDGRLRPDPLEPDVHGFLPAIGVRDAEVPVLGPGRQRRRDRFAGRHDREHRSGRGRAVSTIGCDGAPCTATAYPRAVTVSLAATDGHGSGVDAIRYTTDGSAPTLTSPAYTTPFDVQQTATIRFFATDRVGNAEAERSQLVQITPAPVRISFGWDDGKFSLYNLAWQRALQPHNVRSTFYINTGDVGTGESGPTTPGFMTWAQLSALYAAGNEIGGHTVNHINLATLPDDASRTTRRATIDRRCCCTACTRRASRTPRVP